MLRSRFACSFSVTHLPGRRLVVKGEYAMGACDLTSAPCAYITIVREPIARLVSFYKYICLQG